MKGSKSKEVVMKIPSHWGKRKLIGWEIIEPWSCARLSDTFKTKEEAIKEYPRYLTKEYNPFIGLPKHQKPRIYPIYKYEGAIANPIVVDWKKGFVPKKKSEC